MGSLFHHVIGNVEVFFGLLRQLLFLSLLVFESCLEGIPRHAGICESRTERRTVCPLSLYVWIPTALPSLATPKKPWKALTIDGSADVFAGDGLAIEIVNPRLGHATPSALPEKPLNIAARKTVAWGSVREHHKQTSQGCKRVGRYSNAVFDGVSGGICHLAQHEVMATQRTEKGGCVSEEFLTSGVYRQQCLTHEPRAGSLLVAHAEASRK